MLQIFYCVLAFFNLRSFYPCVVVSQVASSWVFGFFYFDEFVEIVFPSFFRSSNAAARSCCWDEARGSTLMLCSCVKLVSRLVATSAPVPLLHHRFGSCCRRCRFQVRCCCLGPDQCSCCFPIFWLRGWPIVASFVVCPVSFFTVFFVLALVLSARLDDESEHLALRPSNNFLVFKRSSPCACSVQHRRRDDSVKKAQSVEKQVRSGRQFLSVLGKRWPSTSDSVLHFDRLLLKRQKFVPDTSPSRPWCHRFVILFVCFIFGLIGFSSCQGASSAPFFLYSFLKSVIIFLGWFREEDSKSTSSANLMFKKQCLCLAPCLIPSLSPSTFSNHLPSHSEAPR